MKILFFIVSVILAIFVQIISYNKISKTSKSRFNARTIYVAKLIFINLIPFILFMTQNNNIDLYSYKTIYLFSSVLVIDGLLFMLGYLFGYKYRLDFKSFVIRLSKNSLNIVFVMMFCILLTTFFMLASKGLGIKEWVFNTRYAYQFGRRGLGHYYVLYQIFSMIILSLGITKSIQYRKGHLVIILAIITAYFTGSKNVIFSFFLVLIYFYDFAYKSINIKYILMLLSLTLFSLIGFLQFQSSMSLVQYSTYYINFFRLLENFNSYFNDFYWGKLALEEFIWNIVPRTIIQSKPLIYGQAQIMAAFYGSEVIAQGHFPSFSNFAVPYADFGLAGIAINSLFGGFGSGVLENSIKKNFEENGYTFAMVFLYVILFIIAPINLNLIFVIVILMTIIILLKMLTKV